MGAKVETYIGFCLRARKIALGSGTVELLKKGVYLVLVCSTASENTFKLAIKFKNRFNCLLFIMYPLSTQYFILFNCIERF